MTLSIRSPEADALARRLAHLDRVTITDAVIIALKEAILKRSDQETPAQTAKRLLSARGLAFVSDRKPVPDSVWRELDDDLSRGT